MADVEQSGGADEAEFAVMRARLDRTLAFADWANQVPFGTVPPAEPGTAAMTVNEMITKIAGELARIAACYDLKEASNDMQDAMVMSGTESTTAQEYYEEAQQNIKDAQKRLGCPGSS